MRTLFVNILSASLLVLTLFASTSSSQTTYWVKPAGSNNDNGISYANAWKHLSYAVDQVSAGDTIRVTPGDYNVDGNGETFPIPVPAGVTILGSTTGGLRPDPVDYPRIGGDVNQADSTVPAVFRLLADGTEVEGATLKWLRFAGEDSEDEDAPHAVYVEVMDEGVAELLVDTCIIERSEMNNGNADDNRESVLAAC